MGEAQPQYPLSHPSTFSRPHRFWERNEAIGIFPVIYRQFRSLPKHVGFADREEMRKCFKLIVTVQNVLVICCFQYLDGFECPHWLPDCTDI